MSKVEVPERRRVLLHPGLVASGATLLIATCVSDVLYWQTLLFQWNNLFAGSIRPPLFRSHL